MSVIEKLAEAGYLTEDQVSRVRDNVRAFFDEMDSDPGIGKSAAFAKDVVHHLDPAKTVAGIISAGLIVGAATGGRDIYDAVKGKVMHHHNFGKMMEMNPGLKNHDKKMVNAAFNTLHRFNPEYAADPLVAGTFVQNALDMSRVDVGTVNSLVDANSKLQRDTGMNIADALKFVQFKDKPMAHPSQVALWEAQTAREKAGPQAHPEQIAQWRAQAAKHEAERGQAFSKTRGELAQTRQQMGQEQARHIAQMRQEKSESKARIKQIGRERDVQAARAEWYRNLNKGK